MKYRILESVYAGYLEAQVEEALKDGWVLGGELQIAIHPGSGGYGVERNYAQVMLKIEPEPLHFVEEKKPA